MAAMADPQATSPAPAPKRKPRIFFGWWVAIVAVLLNIFQGGVLFYGFTLVITPLTEETGWSRTAVTAVFPIIGIAAAVLSPLLGGLFDRIGPRPIIGGGLLVLGGGMVLLSQVTSLPAFYLAFTLANIGSTAIWSSSGPAVANWFVRRRGRALGLYSLGFALAGIMSPPFFWLLESVGWRNSFVVVGIAAWALIPLAVWVIRHRPEQYGMFPDGADVPPPNIEDLETSSGEGEVNLSARQALRTQAFWLMAIGSSLAFLTIAALQVHWSPYLESVGFSRQAAAYFLPALPLSTVVGRIGFGVLVDMYDKKRVTALAFALQAVAVIALALIDVSRVWLVFLFFVLWSVGFGGTIVTRMALQGYLFGRFSFGALQGLLSMSSEAGFAFAPLIASLAFDALGSYRPLFFAFAFLTFLAAPITLAIVRPRPATRQKSKTAPEAAS